jgi:hypothetical protein
VDKPLVFSAIQASVVFLIYLAFEILLKRPAKSAQWAAKLLFWAVMNMAVIGGVLSIPVVCEMHESWEMRWTSSSEPALFGDNQSKHGTKENEIVNTRQLDSSTGSMLTETGWEPFDLAAEKNLALLWEEQETGCFSPTFVVRAKNGRRYLLRYSYDSDTKWTEMGLVGWPLRTPFVGVKTNSLIRGGIVLIISGLLLVTSAILLTQEHVAGKRKETIKCRARYLLYWFTPILLAGITMFVKGLLVSPAYPPGLFWRIAPLFSSSFIVIGLCGAVIQVLPRLI